MVIAARRLAALVALALAAAACGSDGAPSPPPGPSPQPQRYTVSSVTDGDTLRFTPALAGATTLRLLNIDTPEIGGDTQEPWASAARGELQQMLPAGAGIAIETDVERLDSFNRLLGHAIAGDGTSVNREQLRRGRAVLYVIWPNMANFTSYREAQIDAQAAGRGVWSAASPLRELPFEFRLREDRASPFRPVGDYFTRSYVEAGDYRQVHVNNRVFFNSRGDAETAGYRACARDGAGAYSPSCFSSGS